MRLAIALDCPAHALVHAVSPAFAHEIQKGLIDLGSLKPVDDYARRRAFALRGAELRKAALAPVAATDFKNDRRSILYLFIHSFYKRTEIFSDLLRSLRKKSRICLKEVFKFGQGAFKADRLADFLYFFI